MCVSESESSVLPSAARSLCDCDSAFPSKHHLVLFLSSLSLIPVDPVAVDPVTVNPVVIHPVAIGPVVTSCSTSVQLERR